jgi:hypothetical protein
MTRRKNIVPWLHTYRTLAALAFPGYELAGYQYTAGEYVAVLDLIDPATEHRTWQVVAVPPMRCPGTSCPTCGAQR